MNALPSALRDAILIALVGLLAGLAVNQRLVREAFTGKLAVTPATERAADPARPQPVLLAEVRELLAGGALAVDAREEGLYGDGHLPGARLLPLGALDERLEVFRQAVPAERTLVIYCNGYGCPDSFDLALRLAAAGYRDLRVFEGGFPEWRDAGLPVEKGGS